MNRFLHILWLTIAPNFLVLAESDFGFDWTSDDYEIIYADFDGDTKLDTLLVSRRGDMPSWLLFSKANAIPMEYWQRFNSDHEYLVAGDFDNDARAELLIMQKDLSGRYLELDENDDFVEGEQKLKVSGYNNNRQINFTHLYKGDFNGDTSDDLLAYAAESHDIVVFHNAQKNKKIKFKFDAQLFLENDGLLQPQITDFNNDGLEDIALLSSTEDGKSYVALAGSNGKFKKSDFEDITPHLEGESLSPDQHTIRMWTNPENGERQILRVGNATGGVDEEGNWIDDDIAAIEKSETLNNRSSDDAEDACYDLAYSAQNKRISSICDIEDRDSEARQQPPLVPSQAQNTAPQSKAVVVSSVSVPSSPSSVSAVVQNGDDIKISWSSVSGATYYKREVSLNGAGYQNTKIYNAPQTSVIFYDQKVRSYRYRIQACNASGCSLWRASNTVIIASSLPIPATPNSSPSISDGSYHPVSVSVGISVTAIANATSYQLYVGTSSSNFSPNVSGSSTSLSYWSGSSFGYRYIKYRACNATGCSGLSPWKRILVYTNPGSPNNLTLNKSAVNVGSSASLTWNQAGGQISSGTFLIYETKPGESEAHIATVSANGSSYSRTVSPSGGFGNYSYRVRACNPNSLCGGSASTSISLNNRNPVADDENASVDEGKSVNINVLSGDSDPDSHSLTIISNSNPAKGSVNCSGAYCNYTANSGISANTSDSFTYTISDGYGGSATGTVSITIRNVLTGSVSRPVISPSGSTFNGSQSVNISTSTSGATIYFTTNGNNPSTSSTRYTGAFTLTANTTVKAFAVKSDYANSATATAAFVRNSAPVANGDSASVDEGKSVAINVLANDSDLDGHSLTITGNSNPSKGSVNCSATSCSYTASNNISGNTSDSFTYSISDGNGGTATGSVSVSIRNISEGTVSRPVISPSGSTFNGSQSVSISTSTSGATIYFTTNGNNPSTSSTRYTGALTLTANTTVKAFAVKSDYANSATATAAFVRNSAPVANGDSASVDEGKSVAINVLANDSDSNGHSLAITGNSNPSKGSVNCSAATCNYTANDGITANTSDSFTYTITDGYGGSATGSVSISIRNLSEGTVAKPVISPSGKTFTGSLPISISTSTSGATIYYTTNGSTPSTSSTRYTGAFNITGSNTVKARAYKSDYNASAIDAQSFVRNSAPVANGDSASVDEGKSVAINVLANDSDSNGHSLAITGNSNPSKGSVNCSATTCNYTANDGITANTSDSFTYTITDGYGGSATGSVSISIRNLSEGTVAKPVISPSGKTFTGSLPISISTSTSGATIYYTTNGSNPSTSSTRYTGTFNISSDKTIKAFAVKPDFNNSAVDTDVFDRNYAPSFNAGLNPPTTADSGKQYSFQFVATDPENDSLTFGSNNKPSWLSLNTSTGVLSGTPTAQQAGSYTNIRISVSDGYSTTWFPGFNITVQQTINSAKIEYRYDALGRLVKVIDPVNGNRSYVLDAAGNRTDVEHQE